MQHCRIEMSLTSNKIPLSIKEQPELHCYRWQTEMEIRSPHKTIICKLWKSFVGAQTIRVKWGLRQPASQSANQLPTLLNQPIKGCVFFSLSLYRFQIRADSQLPAMVIGSSSPGPRFEYEWVRAAWLYKPREGWEPDLALVEGPLGKGRERAVNYAN